MIEARALMVFFENMLALNNVSLRCERGTIVGVFGANSAGKSTLMYTLSGILLDLKRKEDMRGGERISIHGEVLLDGKAIDGWEAHRRAREGVILCPERRGLFGESSVLENLRIGAYMATRRQARDTLDYVLELFPPLVPLLRRPAALLSGGEQQMAAIGRSLMAQPRLLLLDEPLLGLAPAIQHDVVEAIPRLRDERGLTVLVAEQYARPLLPCVDHAYILENGSLVLEGSGAELLDDPDVRAAYFGT
jgi:branched-chain amino acid transport system ATP-binding protein